MKIANYLGEDLAQEESKKGKALDTATAAASATPVGKALKVSEYVTDPKKRKRTLWAVLGCTGCCLVPFLIGLVLGISIITQLCQYYYKWWATPVRVASDVVGEIGSWFTGDNTTFLDSICGNPYSSFYNSVIGCNTLDTAMSYMGKVTYVWGGGRSVESRANGSYDCSSFVLQVLEDLGVPNAISQYVYTGTMASKWDGGQDPYVKPVFSPPIAGRELTEEEVRNNVRPGDIIIFDRNRDPSSGIDAHTGYIYSIDYENRRFVWLDNSSDKGGKQEGKGVQLRSRAWNHGNTWNIYRLVSSDTQLQF